MPDANHSTTTTPALRGLFALAATLVFGIGIPLFLWSTETERLFAWTIATPLTAAFLGASYWAAGVMEFLASRRRRWHEARIAVPAVFIFTVLTLIVTLVHLDRFHITATDPVTQTVTWAWIVVYAVVPVLMLVALVLQLRQPAGDVPSRTPLPAWVRLMLVAQGATLAILGIWLLLLPASASPHWPWSLTPLTARAIGAWLFSLGVVALHGAWENDHVRIYPATLGYFVLPILQFVALARFPGDFAWGTTAGMLYLAFLVWMLITTAALHLSRRTGGGATV